MIGTVNLSIVQTDKLHIILCNHRLLCYIINNETLAIQEILTMPGGRRPKLVKMILIAIEWMLYCGYFEKTSQMYKLCFDNFEQFEDIFSMNDWWFALRSFLTTGNLLYKSYCFKIINHLHSQNICCFELLKIIIPWNNQSSSPELLDIIIKIIEPLYMLDECPLHIILNAMIHNNKNFIMAIAYNSLLPPKNEILDQIQILPISIHQDWTYFISFLFDNPVISYDYTN